MKSADIAFAMLMNDRASFPFIGRVAAFNADTFLGSGDTPSSEKIIPKYDTFS